MVLKISLILDAESELIVVMVKAKIKNRNANLQENTAKHEIKKEVCLQDLDRQAYLVHTSTFPESLVFLSWLTDQHEETQIVSRIFEINSSFVKQSKHFWIKEINNT